MKVACIYLYTSISCTLSTPWLYYSLPPWQKERKTERDCTLLTTFLFSNHSSPFFLLSLCKFFFLWSMPPHKNQTNHQSVRALREKPFFPSIHSHPFSLPSQSLYLPIFQTGVEMKHPDRKLSWMQCSSSSSIWMFRLFNSRFHSIPTNIPFQ